MSEATRRGQLETVAHPLTGVFPPGGGGMPMSLTLSAGCGHTTTSTHRVLRRFDAVLHFDETRAVEPLERTAAWERGEVPEAFPTGL